MGSAETRALVLLLRADGALLEPLIKELERKANRKRLPPTWSIDVSNRTIAPKLLKSLLQVLKNYPLHTLTLSDCDLGHTSKLVPGSEKKFFQAEDGIRDSPE
eukprot:COSAG01_NODE_28890_length_650_cov_0.940109_1_plen_103_part_00